MRLEAQREKIIHRYWKHLSRVSVLITQPRCVGVPADLLERRNVTSTSSASPELFHLCYCLIFIIYYLFYCCFVCVSRAHLVPGVARIGQQNFGTGVIDSYVFIWVLGNQPGSSGRTASILNHGAISSVSCCFPLMGFSPQVSTPLTLLRSESHCSGVG